MSCLRCLPQLALMVCGWLLLNVFALSAEPAKSEPDWRDVATGRPIPKEEGYCCMPYVAITKDGNWLCVLTTSPGVNQGQNGQHVIATISADQGKTWSKPVDIEPGKGPDWQMACWATPLVTPSGRVYAFYTYDGAKATMPDGSHIKYLDSTGWYCYRYSDDNGRTWSKNRYRLPMRLTDVDRNNMWKGAVQMFWGLDDPAVINHGRSVIFAFVKLGMYPPDRGEGWFFRSDNILIEPDVERVKWQMLPDGEQGVRSPTLGCTQEEHNLVELNNGDLYCVFRTAMGSPGQCVSKDGGHTWSTPAPMMYRPGGRPIKNPRACPRVWKTSEGKYLFWFHNNKTLPWGGREPVWITGGIERQGAVHWSEPEVLLYHANATADVGSSYPELIEQGGKFWVTAAEHDRGANPRLHSIDRTLLEGLWKQGENREAAREGLVLSLEGESLRTKQVAMPKLPSLSGHGLSLDFQVRLDDLSAGQVLLDWRDSGGRGGLLTTTPDETIQLELSDGKTKAVWDCDRGLLKRGQIHHVTAIVDGGPRMISFLVDGRLCDGGTQRTQGWTRFSQLIDNVNGGALRLAPALKGRLLLLRVYDRYLRTSEAVGNYASGRP